jgi:hypothetical protein
MYCKMVIQSRGIIKEAQRHRHRRCWARAKVRAKVTCASSMLRLSTRSAPAQKQVGPPHITAARSEWSRRTAESAEENCSSMARLSAFFDSGLLSCSSAMPGCGVDKEQTGASLEKLRIMTDEGRWMRRANRLSMRRDESEDDWPLNCAQSKFEKIQTR